MAAINVEELWALRDQVSAMDDPMADPVAAQLHTIYNQLVAGDAPPAVTAAA